MPKIGSDRKNAVPQRLSPSKPTREDPRFHSDMPRGSAATQRRLAMGWRNERRGPRQVNAPYGVPTGIQGGVQYLRGARIAGVGPARSAIAPAPDPRAHR